MINWMPIESAPKDLGHVLLWLVAQNGNGYVLHDCAYAYKNDCWCRWRADVEQYVSIRSGDVATHFAKIEPPQVPLDWPNENGFYWISDPSGALFNAYKPFCAYVDLGNNACDISLQAANIAAPNISGLFRRAEYQKKRIKFLPAPIPSFGGDDGK